VNSEDDADLFRAKLEGAYDWLHALQFVAKLPGSRRTSGRDRTRLAAS
jgi:hypothetical protein